MIDKEKDEHHKLNLRRVHFLVRRPEPTSAPCSPPRVLYLPAALLIGDLVDDISEAASHSLSTELVRCV